MYLVLFLKFSVVFASLNYHTEKHNEHFSVTVYKSLIRTNSDFVASPFLIESVFAIFYLGSEWGTAKEMRQLFDFPRKNVELIKKFKKLVSFLNEQNFHVEHKMLWDEVEWIPRFENDTKEIFQSFQLEAFEGKKEQVEKLNSWFREQTNNKIDYMIKSLKDLEKAVISAFLFSASHFEGKWSEASSERSVNARYFHYGTLHNKSAKLVELPFEKSEASMVLIFPENANDFHQLEAELAQILERPNFTKSEPATISLPKFRFEHFVVEYNHERLAEMGIRKALYGGDYKYMTAWYNVHVNYFTEKVYLKVNEQGVEVASGLAPPFGQKSFWSGEKSDFPFIFYIKIRRTILYIGRHLVNPH